MTTPEQLTLHEEILLLVLRDREGAIEFGANLTHALGGAILAELLLGKRITVEERDGNKKRVEIAGTAPFGESVLDQCLDMVATSSKLRTLQSWVGKFGGISELHHRVARGLCRRGILRTEEDKVLLIFSRTVYPEVDPAPEQAIIERLREAIFTDIDDIDPRTIVLLSLAHGAGLLPYVFDKKELKTREDRIERVVNGEVTGRATEEVIEAMQTALLVTVIIPAITTTVIN